MNNYGKITALYSRLSVGNEDRDGGAKMHIRIDCRNDGKRHVVYCSKYYKGKVKNPKCHSPQITTRLEQIEKVLDKLYKDNALGTIPQDRYEQMSRKYSEEYYTLKGELEEIQGQLSAFENAGGRAQRFVKLPERYADFTELTPAIFNEFISKIEVHERDQKPAKYAIQHIGIYFNHVGKFENEVTQHAEPTEQEIRQMREEIEEAKKEKGATRRPVFIFICQTKRKLYSFLISIAIRYSDICPYMFIDRTIKDS